MRTVLMRRVMLSALGMLAAASMVACSAQPASTAAQPGNARTETPAPRPTATAAASPTASMAASPPAATPSATPTASDGIQNLVVSSEVLSELTATFLGYYDFAPSEVQGGGPLPGTVYYADDPADNTYWALASFGPADGAPSSVGSLLEPTDGQATFRRYGSGPWEMFLPKAGPYWVCSEIEFVPPAVLTAWAIPTTPPPGFSCQV
jgi:hypothetical protein